MWARMVAGVLLGSLAAAAPTTAGLRPVQTETRWVMPLAGVWRARLDPLDVGRVQQWWGRAHGLPPPVMDAPVPSSIQELQTPDSDIPDFSCLGLDRERGLQEYLGAVWYQTKLWVPSGWWGAGRSLSLRFDGATSNAEVWVQGTGPVASHRGIALPFATGDLSHVVGKGGELTILVRVDAQRTWADVPPGRMVNDSWGRQTIICGDGFPSYTGLDRSVWLVSTPASPAALTSVRKEGGEAVVGWNAVAEGCEGCPVAVSLVDGVDGEVARGEGQAGEGPYTLRVPNATLWEAAPGNPHLYSISFALNGSLDIYRMNVGLRTVTVSGGKLLLNGKPLYLRGADIHANAPLFGAAYDASGSMVARDTNLLRSLGANSFRMNSWPPPEELLDLCDRHGFLIQNEVPGIGLTSGWDPLCPHAFAQGCVDDNTLATHERLLRELVARDGSRTSVGIWSVANEPSSKEEAAVPYFSSLLNLTRALDPQQRPVTFVTDQDVSDDVVHKALSWDLICINRYFGWYNSGAPRSAEPLFGSSVLTEGPAPLGRVAAVLEAELRAWHAAYPTSPVVVSEYGAGAASGWHAHEPRMYTEEFQVALLAQDHVGLDAVRGDFLVGEHVHAFHDFRQGVSRPNAELGLNFKGLHSHDRQPKAAARLIRDRYHRIVQEEKKEKMRKGRR